MIRWTLPALALSLAGLLVPQSWNLEARFLVHLAVLALWGFGLATKLVTTVMATGLWFSNLSARRSRQATALGVLAFATFAMVLVALASSAALRYDPSTQFLQLISAADIAWVVTGLMIGLSFRTNRMPWLAAGLAMTVVCVWSIYRYVDVVGFGAEGQWLVDAGEMLRLVIPFDVMAAAITIGAILWGSADYAIEQPSAQS